MYCPAKWDVRYFLNLLSSEIIFLACLYHCELSYCHWYYYICGLCNCPRLVCQLVLFSVSCFRLSNFDIFLKDVIYDTHSDCTTSSYILCSFCPFFSPVFLCKFQGIFLFASRGWYNCWYIKDQQTPSFLQPARGFFQVFREYLPEIQITSKNWLIISQICRTMW